MMRVIEQVAMALRKAKKRGEQDDEDEVDEDLGNVFADAVGLSASYLEPSQIGMIPAMLALNPDPARLVLTARVLVGLGQQTRDEKAYFAVARRLLAQTEKMSLIPELRLVRDEVLATLA